VARDGADKPRGTFPQAPPDVSHVPARRFWTRFTVGAGRLRLHKQRQFDRGARTGEARTTNDASPVRTIRMTPVQHASRHGTTGSQPFGAGRTGALALALFAYLAIAIALILNGGWGGPAFDVFNLYSDSVASIGTTILAGAAARGTSDRYAKRTWWLLAAALGVYSAGNLSHSTYWLFGIDPFPSIGDVFFLLFYPLVFAAVLIVVRASAVRLHWARLGLDATILTLGFGAFFWFCIIEPTAAAQSDIDMLKYALAQSYIALNCVTLLACGVLLMHAGATAIPRRVLVLLTLGFASMSLADIVWAMSKVLGSYLPGDLSDVIYLSCYLWLAAAAREQLRGLPKTPAGPPGPYRGALPYAAMMVSFLVLVYVESSNAASPVNAMTVVIFVLTSLVMVRQGVLSRDDALVRERRAAGRVEARYASLIRNAADVIMIAGVDGLVRFASPAAERTFGRRPDDLVGLDLFDLWTDGDRERLAAFLAEVAAATQGRVVGPIEATVATGERRIVLECVGSNLTDDAAIEGLALNFRDVSERKALEEQLRKLAFHDPLTLLANRSLFWNRVEHALALAQRTQQCIAVMFLDLDNFKNVNDSLGHDVGDRLLQAVAQRLVKATRASDTVARLGGDEFAILLEGLVCSTDVVRIAAPITEAFDQPLLLDGRETDVSASIGVACSKHGDDAEQLLRKADIAMYNAKAAGKARLVVFESHMQEQLHDRLRLEQDLDLALARNEFFVEFQPVVDLTRRELLGVEALVRWRHPERGLVMPGAFIPLAEESGRIVELSRRVLLEACTQVRAWSGSVAAGDGLRVAVNVSGRHLQQGNLVADVRHALEVSGLDPGNLVIELTESTIMQNTDVNLEYFRQLKALGVRLAIDDFGVGYSSLSYLHRFPIDILKIDRAFVNRLTEQDGGPELARAVVMLGTTLGLETVAEGIENELQAAALFDLGCVAGQGFLFAGSCSLETIARSPYMDRRAKLRAERVATFTDLTATGRFQARDFWPHTTSS
jgi:diguanylate cyclase (GGDEF)-like protein/PAS domain S-box-containing protein